MTRILFLGDSAGTGFGTVTKDLGTALLKRGDEVRFLSLNEQIEELEEPFVGRTAVLGLPDGWLAAKDVVGQIEGMFTGGLFTDGWVPQVALVLGDMGSLKVSPVVKLIPPGFPAFHYVPIEGVWLPPAWADVWKRLEPIAVSNFGADEIAKVTGRRPPVVYHGVNTDDFFPVSPTHRIVLRTKDGLISLRSKADCRRFLGWPQDAFIMFRADRHMPRKDYPALFRAVAPVLQKHPDALLIAHARVYDQGGDFSDDVSHFGPLAQRMVFSGVGGSADRKLLAAMYGGADLYVSNSAEGFGLTIAESLACGTPAVGLDYASVPEVIGPAGVLVPVGNLVDNIYGHFWAHVHEGAMTEAIEKLYADRAGLALLGMKGPAHVREHFSWPKAGEQIGELLGGTVERLAERAEVAA